MDGWMDGLLAITLLFEENSIILEFLAMCIHQDGSELVGGGGPGLV